MPSPSALSRLEFVDWLKNMPMDITLRTGASTSPFRDRLLRLCSLPIGDSLILCSGFFQENVYNYSILSDSLLGAINSNGKIRNVELRGLMCGSIWNYGFRNFIAGLRNAGLSVSAYRAKGRKWHAKIAIRVDKGVPIAAIVGSSNLTRPPFGVAPMPGWNFECDVTIWKDDPVLTEVFRIGESPTDEKEFVMMAALAENVPQPDESERLAQLLDTIRGTNDEFIEI